MERKTILELLPCIRVNGRAVWDEKDGGLYCNWSASGITVGIEGTELRVKAAPLADELRLGEDVDPFLLWPSLGASEGGELIFRAECREEEWFTIFLGKKQRSEITLLKLNENARGKLKLLELETDGRFVPLSASDRKQIEFVGDSITCGFGNETNQADGTIVENVWTTFGVRTVLALDMDIRMICRSGICAVYIGDGEGGEETMEDIYPYTDALLDDRLQRDWRSWDFQGHPSDVVVVDLGTNDAFRVGQCREKEQLLQRKELFKKGYMEFIRQIRRYNGESCLICCCIGPMWYDLEAEIRKSVEELQNESGKTVFFRFSPIDPETEGYGAEYHPSGLTHKRMSEELTEFLRGQI
ncbi:MAG: SGNH/GDSL hydrolase family protein [Oscillospiraceae bacterium]|nr:SGNH/GDSL hydrolase family protein [Oscillospiraceae bacterium]